jgi:fumarate hydratase subunit beta
MSRIIKFPLLEGNELEKLHCGDRVEINGYIYAARDAAHKKFISQLKNKKGLPVNLKNSLIYYMGPSPAPEGKIIGACGPTTSIRMDNLTPPLFKLGLKATMGKGMRSEEFAANCKKYKAVYFVTFGGCGAFLSKFVKDVRITAYKNLGPEAVYQLAVENFPAIVGIDTSGNSVYNT